MNLCCVAIEVVPRIHLFILLGYVSPVFGSDEIAKARRALASDQPRYTTQQVLEHLESLNRK